MKKNFLLLLIITATITSCSTSYKTGQTPDDVYYSPARIETYEVRNDKDIRDDNTVYTNSDDREIRRRIRNQRYRRYDDNYNYPYGYYGPVYGNPKYGTTEKTSEPRKTNLGAYTPNSSAPDSVTTNPKSGKFNNTTITSPVRTFENIKNPSNKGSAVGNMIRKVFSNGNSSYDTYKTSNSNNSSSSRTFETKTNNNNNNNSGSGSRSSSSETKSSNSNSAPVRTFGKQN